jgi:protocatechuate 3,4-dioxygenase beta subunit
LSTKTLAVSASIGVVLYLGWLGWKDLLTAPVLPAPEPVLLVEGGGASAPGDVARSAAETPTGMRVDSVRRPWAAAGVHAETVPLAVAAPSGESDHALVAGLARATPDVAPPTEMRRADVSEPTAPPPTDDDEEARNKRRSRSTLGGWVLDRDGHPAAGVPIGARLRRLFAALDTGATDSATEGRSETDAAGRFTFAELPDGEYELRTDQTELYEKATAVVRAGVDSAVLVVDGRSRRSVFVHGVVESARGGPLGGVRVEVVGRPRLAALSDQTGAYGLGVPVGSPPEGAALRFARNGYRELRLPLGGDETEAADVVQNVRLEPTSQLASVSGRLSGDDGGPVSGASVQLYSAGRGRRFQSVSDAGGRFLLTGVEESDDYRLWVHPARGYRDHTREGVEVRGQVAALDVTLELLGTARLRGSMVDPEGRPLPGFTLWLRPAYGASGPTAVTGDAQGRFATGDLPEGPVALETRAAPHLAVTGIALDSGTPREVVIPLDVGSYRLEGTLRAENGAPVGGARLSLHWSRAEGGLGSRSFRETTSDATGYFLFTQLGAGVHTLSATAVGYRSVRLDQPVGPGTPPIEIKLAASP